MNKSRRIGAVVAMATAAAGMATVATAAPAAAADRGPQPVSNWLTAVRANTVSWVNIYWHSGRTVCDTQVRVNGGRWVDVGYPGNRRSASFPRGGTLRAGRSDYTAVRVDPDFDRSGIAQLRATIEYTSCGWNARTESKAFALNLPVIRDGRPAHAGGGPVILPGGPTAGFPGGGPVILPGGPATPGGPVILPGGPVILPGGPVIVPGTPGQPVAPVGPVVLPGGAGQPGTPVILNGPPAIRVGHAATPGDPI
jgi:hypothetical protein